MPSWAPAAGLGLLSLVAALTLGAAPRDASAAADRAGAVTGVGTQPFIIIAAPDPAPSHGRTLASALRAQGAWLVIDPGLAGPCAPPA